MDRVLNQISGISTLTALALTLARGKFPLWRRRYDGSSR